MFVKKLAPIRVTEDQNKWLNNEKARTGNGTATIIRLLVQKEVTKQEATQGAK